MSKRIFSVFLSLITFFCLSSCNTIKVSEEDTFTSIPYIIEENVKFPDLEDPDEPYKYIFLRLYNPIYSNPFYIANILKGGIQITEISDFELSHASINLSLDDGFYGLTLAGNSQFSKEYCTDTNTNGYMEKCNPATSEQITFALKVTEQEYEYIGEFINFYSKYPKLTYAALQNFKIAIYSLKRKFFTKKDKQAFGLVNQPERKKPSKKELEGDYVESDFVCSTFITYILINTIPRINDWFNDHNVNYEYTNVTDIPSIPGVTPLFYSTWNNYSIAAELFAQVNPEFKEYLNN